ncbi:recombination regulator RecX [Paraburkholderia acidisoli]|uniref:Regulatory protein RecX n=1 Tax=Paraburkholderia acidisoli TaxID=2571748 RepID=A0A7Z2JEE6_9BURK|nr:recombination regulator RecX [Paraburkholderia acidisoli]QGZ62272.1 recombination regulator RecX [Paraburkholderia acidisoli]
MFEANPASADVPESSVDLSDDGGAVFEVPFEAFFGANHDADNATRARPGVRGTPRRGTYGSPAKTALGKRVDKDADESIGNGDIKNSGNDNDNDSDSDSDAPQGDRYERSSATRAARQSAREASASTRQRPERSLKGRALGYLSRREYSRAELSRKLMPYVEDADKLEVMLDSLEREGWLSDARFAESVVHRRAARVGSGRIVSELKRHAVGEALIEEVSTQLRETELVRARAVWRKKYGELPETPAERARQARFLAARGFSMSIIGKILKGIDEDWSGD